jgi:hypothetical protein
VAYQRGDNGGLTGPLIDIKDGPTFRLNVSAWEVTQGVASLPVPGRGDSDQFVPTIAVQPGGTVVVTGTAQFDQPPTPADFQGRAGNIVETLHLTAKYTTPVRIDRAAISLAKDPQDGWKVTLTGTVTGFPTIEGFAAGAAAAADPDAIEKELFQGLSRTHDPVGLLDAAARLFIVRPIANNDAAELAKIQEIVAEAVAPFPGAKVKTANMPAGRMQDTAYFALSFAHTTSEEDVVNAVEQVTTDDNHLAGGATTAGVFSSPSNPGGGLVERTTTTAEIHDGATLTTKTWGERDTVDDVEMPGTEVRTDDTNLDHGGQETAVFPFGGPEPTDPTVTLPADAKVVYEAVQRLTRARSKKVFAIGMRTPKQEIEWLQSRNTAEPDALKQGAIVVEVTDSATADTDGNPDTTNLSFHSAETYRITDTQFVHAKQFLPLTEQEAMTAQWQVDEDDEGDLTDEHARVDYSTDGTPPAAPASPNIDQVHVRTSTKRVGKAKYRHVYSYAYRTTQEQLEADRTRTTTDPDGIESSAVTADVFPTGNEPSTPAAPSEPFGLKLDGFDDYTTPNPDYTLRVYRWALTTSGERWINQQTKVIEGANGLEDAETRAAFDAAPGLTRGLLQRSVTQVELNDGKIGFVIEGGRTAPVHDITFRHIRDTLDANGLKSAKTTALVYEYDAPPPAGSPPSDPPGLKLVDYFDVPITATANLGTYKPLRLRVWVWGHTDSLDDVVFAKTRLVTDPGLLGDLQVMADVWDTDDTEPAAPTPEDTTLVLRDTEYENLTANVDGTVRRQLRVFTFARNTRKQDIERAGTFVQTDADHVTDRAETTEVYPHTDAAGSPVAAPADPAAPDLNGDLVIHSQRTEEIDGRSAKRWTRHELFTAKQEQEFKGTIARYTHADNIDRRITEILDSDTGDAGQEIETLLAAYVASTAKTDATIRSVTYQRINKLNVERTIERFALQPEQVEVRGWGGYKTCNAVLIGGTVYVYVAAVFERAGIWSVLTKPTVVHYAECDIYIRKPVSGTNLPIRLDLLGKKNDAAIMGLPAGDVTYKSGNPRTERSIAAPHVMEANHVLNYSSRGQFTEGDIVMTWLDFDSDPGVTARQYAPASSLGFTAGEFADADFSGLLTY